jgi:hypothetical protein
MSVRPIQPAEVDDVWPLVADLISVSCRRGGGDATPDELRELCKQPGHMLILLDGGVAILQRCGDFLHIRSLGGRGFLKQIPDLMPVWWDIAILIGCTGLSLKGRRGWSRVLENYGFVQSENGFLEAR